MPIQDPGAPVAQCPPDGIRQKALLNYPELSIEEGQHYHALPKEKITSDWLRQPMLARPQRCLCAVTQGELAEDAGDVIFDGALGDEQLFADLAVALAAR